MALVERVESSPMKRVPLLLVGLAGAGLAAFVFAPSSRPGGVGAHEPAPLPRAGVAQTREVSPLALPASKPPDATSSPAVAVPAPQPPSGASAAASEPPAVPPVADTVHQAVVADMSSRTYDYALRQGLSSDEAQAISDALTHYLVESHNLQLAVLNGEMPRQAAGAELADMHNTLHTELRDRLGHQAYDGLRAELPGKW